MEDWIGGFVFDLQRFADNTFTGGAVEGEEGITLSKLFTNAGSVWQVTDAAYLNSRTYFWENAEAKVSLSAAGNNAPGSAADGITLVKGTYDDPIQLADGSWAYGVDEVEAIDVSGVNDTATFSKLDGVTEILNPGGTIDITGDNLGAIKFGGNTSKEWNYDFDYEVGTIIHLNGAKEIINVDAAPYEEITSADGTKVVFKKGGTATFATNSFDYVTSSAQYGVAELDITKSDSKKTVSVNNLADSSEVSYTFNASGDIVDLTSSTAQGTVSINAGAAKFVVADDVSDAADLIIDGTEYKFADAGGNGGVFVVENNKAVGFVFRDTEDAVTVPKGSSSFKFYEQADSDNESFDDVTEVAMGFSVTSTDSEYTVTKTDDGYSIEVGGNTTLTTDGGATIAVTMPGDATEIISFDADGRVQSIADGTAGEGTSLTINGLTAAEIAGDVLYINDVEITPNGDEPLSYSQGIELDSIITGTDGNDSIHNTVSGATINALGGDDTIKNGWHDDTWHPGGSNVKISGGDGDDYIYSHSAHDTTIEGGAGNDDIYNDFASDIKIEGGAGDDTLYNVCGSNVTINGGDGNDFICDSNAGTDVTINGGGGDDRIWTFNSFVSIDAGLGDDSINNSGTNVTLNTGKGNDTISLNSDAFYNVIEYKVDDGNDLIEGFNETSTLSISGSSYSTQASGSDVIVTVGDGKITLVGAAGLEELNIAGNYVNPLNIVGTAGAESITNTVDGATINALGGNDTIDNYGSNVTINGGTGDDDIENSAVNVLINGDAGNDTIGNDSYGTNATLRGDDGNDSIWNNAEALVDGGAGDDVLNNRNGGSNATVLGGTGNDSILNSAAAFINGGAGNDTLNNTNLGSNATLSGEAGNDLIWTYNADNVSINGGAGDDAIWIFNSANGLTVKGGTGDDVIRGVSLEGGVLYQYAVGDGNDTISGFNEGATLSISGGEYTRSTVGNDVILTIGDGSITLIDAATLSTVNIAGKEAEKPAWRLKNTTATYGTSSNTLITVSGIKSLDGLSLSGKVVTVNASAMSSDVVTISDGYTLALNQDVTIPEPTPEGWQLSGTTATYSEEGQPSYYVIKDSQITFCHGADGEVLVTVSGVTSTDGLELDGSTVTVSEESLDEETVTISDGYTLKLGNDVTKTSTTSAGWSLDDSTATYKAASTSAGYSLANNQISYVEASGGDDLVTVSGVKSLDGLALNRKVVTVSEESLDEETVTISDGYTLALGADVTTPETTEAGWTLDDSTATYKAAATSAGYSLANNQISYVESSGGNTLVTVSGVKSLDGLALNGKVVTVSEESLDEETVTISNGYTLALSSDVPKTSTTSAGWSLDDSTATYKAASTSAGYSLANNQISYVEASGGDDLFTIAGISSTVGVTLNDKEVTLSNTALANRAADIITISDGYTLKLATGVDTIKEDVSAWTTLDGGNVAYLEHGTGDYYSLSGGNKITYNESVAGANKIELSGVKGKPKLGEGIVSLTASNFSGDASIVSNDGGYGFALSGNLASKTFTATAGDDTIINSSSKGTITAGAGNDTITNDSKGKTVLFKYNEGDGNDSIVGFNTTSTLQIGGGTGTYSTVKSESGADILVTVGDGTITLVGAAKLSKVNINGTLKKEEALVATNRISNKTVEGTAYDDLINNRANTVTVNGGGGDDELTTKRKTSNVKLYGGDGDDTLESGYGATNILFDGGDGNDEISSEGSNNTIIGGAGDDTIEIESTGTLIKYTSGDGNDLIEGFNADDTLQIANGTGTYSITKNGSDIIVTVGDGSITLSGAATLVSDVKNPPKNFDGVPQTNDSLIIDDTTKSPLTIASAVEVVDATKRKKYTLDVTGNDLDNTIIAGAKSTTMDGGDGYDSLVGSAQADSIYGGEGNDTLWGKAGSDTLTGGDGDDVFIYTAGKDVITDYTEGEDALQVTGTYTSSIKGSDVILRFGSASKTLTLKDAKYKEIMFVDADGNEVETKRFGVTIVKTQKYTAKEGEEYLDATERKGKTTITGNESNNTIFGALSYSNTIYGGEGSDSLIGGNKTDLLEGGDDDDILLGGAGNDTLTGGDGDDLFIYTAGKDTITDYAAGEDVISLGAATFGEVTWKNSGSNVVCTIGSGTLTVKNGKGKQIFLRDADGNSSVIGGSNSYVTLDNDNPEGSSYTADKFDVSIDATKRTKAIAIRANDLNNTILGGSGVDVMYGEDGNDSLVGNAGNDKLYGGDGDDTLVGGKGNDSLWGGDASLPDDDGADTFIYNSGDGKDVIYGFDDDDMLQITATSFTAYYREDALHNPYISINVGSTAAAIQLKDYNASTFNINGDLYAIKEGGAVGTKLTKVS